MPTYDYACSTCQHEFELKLPMADNSLPESQPCPSCSSLSVKQFVPSMNIVDPVRIGVTRTPGAFNEVLNRIKSKHPRHMMHNPKSPANITQI